MVDGVRDAVELVGGQQELARIVGRTQAAVSQWLYQGVPDDEAPKFEELFGVPADDVKRTSVKERRGQ
jgi:DNA-binding transcriptional regulator YdaS (Cro superfamily)